MHIYFGISRTNFQSLVQDIYRTIGQNGTMKDAILYNTIVKQDAALSKTGLDTTIEEYERL